MKKVQVCLPFKSGAKAHAVDPSLFEDDDGWPDGHLCDVSKPFDHANAVSDINDNDDGDDDNLKSRSRKSWWKSLTDIDPITLEPLSALAYPPFVLESNPATNANGANSSRVSASAMRFYFDGEALAEFLTTSANFSNPMNREPLSKADCERLDRYLSENHLEEFNVCRLFVLSRNLAKNSRKRQQRRQSLQDSRQQALLINRMFPTSDSSSSTAALATSEPDAGTPTSAHARQQRRKKRPEPKQPQDHQKQWPALSGGSSGGTGTGNSANGLELTSQYSYQRQSVSEAAGLKVVDDDEWVESSIVPVNPHAGEAPVKWPVALSAGTVASSAEAAANTNPSQSTKALSWRSKSHVGNTRPDRQKLTRERPRLKLLPRTRPLDSPAGLPLATRSLSLASASPSSSAPRGKGMQRPLGTTLSSNQLANFERSIGRANISPTLLRLTGYPSSMLLFIADGRRQWAATIEKKHFATLVSAADEGKNAHWQPTHDTARANVHFLLCLAEHWGLRIDRAKPEAPVFHAYSGCAVPSVLISDAVKLPHVAWMLDAAKSGNTFADSDQRDIDQQNEEEPGMFWTLDDESDVEEAKTSELKSKNDNRPASLPRKHFLKLSSLAASILLTNLSFAGGSGGSLSDEIVEHNIATSLSRNRGRGSNAGGRSTLQQVSRFLWVSNDAVVLRCTTATDARRLCSQLQMFSSSVSTTGSQGSRGMTTLASGLRCHIQWCSAPMKDLNEQQNAIEAVVRESRNGGHEAEEKRLEEKRRRREARGKQMAQQTAQKSDELQLQQKSAFDALVESSSDEDDEDDTNATADAETVDELIALSNQYTVDPAVEAAFDEIKAMGFIGVTQETVSRLMQDNGHDIGRVVEQLLLNNITDALDGDMHESAL